MEHDIAPLAERLAPRVIDETRLLVDISTPSGELAGTERAVELCGEFLPGWQLTRPPCSTSGCAPDLLATCTGAGTRRLLLLGHLDTVVAHEDHRASEERGERLYGSGTADMKGGVALALAVARTLAARSGDYAELTLLLVCDEEWRLAPFAHAERFAGYDACLCFEAGEVDERDVVTIFRLGHNFAVLALIALGRRFDEDDSFSDWSVLAAEEADLGQFLNGRSALARLCRCAGVQDSRR